MQQIFIHIQKQYSITVLLLYAFRFLLTIQSHSYHRSKMISSANFLSGGVYQQINDVRIFEFKNRKRSISS
jgi:rod shape-determining protein MreC